MVETVISCCSANSTYRQESVRNAEMSNRIEELSYNKSRLEGELSETQGRVRTADSDLRNLKDHLKNKDLEIKVMYLLVRYVLALSVSGFIYLLSLL